MKDLICLIPSRYKSSRLPGKALLKIAGKSIIERTFTQVSQCKNINNDQIYVVTDDERIEEEVKRFGGQVIIVKDNVPNGTERICLALQRMTNKNKHSIIVNVQGDEPYINPEYIDKAIDNYIKRKKNYPRMVCSTLHHVLPLEEVPKTSCGKMVLDYDNNILYNSRNIIPANKEGGVKKDYTYYGHIGIFVFDRNYLENFYMNENTRCQVEEDIEWLKIIEQGWQINSVLVGDSEPSVDTLEDLENLRKKYET